MSARPDPAEASRWLCHASEPEGLALRELTDWYLAARYPGDWTEPTREDAVASLATAEMIVGAVVARLSVFKDPA